MTAASLEVLNRLGTPRVLVVGDLILDRHLVGAVERISPEAPIQILRVEHESERLGGAGFTAQNVAVLGGRTTLLGVVGDDPAGARMRTFAEQAGVRAAFVVEPGRRTSVKTRHLARSHSTPQQVLRVDEETTAPIGEATVAALLAAHAEALAASDVVLVNDYGKGLLTAPTVQRVIEAAREAGVPVIVDPHKGTDFARYARATCVTPNRPETAGATGLPVSTLAEAGVAAERLLADLDLAHVLVTLDRDGMLYRGRDGAAAHLSTTPREVFDVSGAGDVVLSVFGLALASGAQPVEAAALANVAAGLEVERVGVVPITREEIAARLGRPPVKRVPRAEAAALGARLRAAGRRIVFTNGCFDLLHAGHVRYLAAARALGDVLVVGLNGDDSVRRLKGPARPLTPYDDRAEVLAALAVVDHVVPFDEDVPEQLIQEVQPDVLVKGSDYATQVVVGREIVEARGGRVVLVDLVEGRSTSALVERIRSHTAE